MHDRNDRNCCQCDHHDGRRRERDGPEPKSLWPRIRSSRDRRGSATDSRSVTATEGIDHGGDPGKEAKEISSDSVALGAKNRQGLNIAQADGEYQKRYPQCDDCVRIKIYRGHRDLRQRNRDTDSRVSMGDHYA